MLRMSDSKAESATVGLESVDAFCYAFGDMLSAGGGVKEAVRCRGEMCLG